jgi:hypothetical protein
VLDVYVPHRRSQTDAEPRRFGMQRSCAIDKNPLMHRGAKTLLLQPLASGDYLAKARNRSGSFDFKSNTASKKLTYPLTCIFDYTAAADVSKASFRPSFADW